LSRREEKKPEITAEGSLSPQLGSNTTDLVTGKFDMRRLSKLGTLDKVWLSYFLMVPKKRGGRYWSMFCDNYMNLAVSDDGWRVNKMIAMVAGSKGAPSVGELVKKPGVLQRNITQRDWKKKADEKGQTIVE